MLSSGVSFLKNHLREETYEEFFKTARDKFEINHAMKAKELLLTQDLQVTRPLCLGVFGSGVLVQHKKSKAHFVMKVFDKERLLKENCVGVLLKEKRLLSACRFPFILEVSHCLQARCQARKLLDFINNIIQDVNRLFLLYQVKTPDDFIFRERN